MKRTSIKPLKPNVALEEFLSGETLRYRDYEGKAAEATYRVGDGVYLERSGKEVGKVGVTVDYLARRLYHNLTRSSSWRREA